MTDDRGLRVLLQACREALGEARAGRIDIVDAVATLERLCARLKAELDAQTTP